MTWINDVSSRQPSVMLISRDTRLAGIIRDQLSAGTRFQQVETSSGTAFETVFSQTKIDAVLIDVCSGNTDDAEVLVRKIRLNFPELAILILAETKNPDNILSAFRAGISDYIIAPFEGDNRVDTALQKALHKESGKTGEVIAITGSKGGQGSTTIAVNLADRLSAFSGKNILLTDFKLRGGDISVFLDIENAYSVADMKKDLARLDRDLLLSALYRHPNGFYVLFAPEAIEQAGRIRPEDLRIIFDILREHMDIIIVDLPLDFQDISTHILDLADRIFLIVQQTVPSVRDARKTLDLFREVGFDKEKVQVILNRFSEKNDIQMQDVTTVIDQDIFATISNDFHTINTAINRGQLLSSEHADTRISKDIDQLTQKLTGMELMPTPKGAAFFLKKLREQFLGKKQMNQNIDTPHA